MMLPLGSLTLAISPQLTAFFTSAAIFASSVAVNSFSAKATGHMAPLSRFAVSLKPNDAYLALNLCALWKKQTTLPSLAYAGIPYQVFGERAGALALMLAWSRSAMARSGSSISAIFASTSLSPSALFLFARASAFSSWARSFIAARSSSVHPSDVLSMLFADFCVAFFAFIVPSCAGSRMSCRPPGLAHRIPICWLVSYIGWTRLRGRPRRRLARLNQRRAVRLILLRRCGRGNGRPGGRDRGGRGWGAAPR